MIVVISEVAESSRPSRLCLGFGNKRSYIFMVGMTCSACQAQCANACTPMCRDNYQVKSSGMKFRRTEAGTSISK